MQNPATSSPSVRRKAVVNLAATDYPDLADFGHDPWWLVLIKAVAVFAFLVANPLVAILAERKIMARMQARLGPNRVGPHGMLQSMADGVKLALKEGITPFASTRSSTWSHPSSPWSRRSWRSR